MEPLEPIEPAAPTTAPTGDTQAASALRPNRLTAGIVAGGAAFAMVLAGLGIASAQTDDATSDSTTPPAAAEGGTPAPDAGHRRHGPGDVRPSLAVAASTLGISEDAVKAQLQAGKSLAEIAGDKTPALIDALVADAEARLAQAVTDGKLTQAQADERKAGLRDRITKMVNATPPAPGERRGPGGPGGPGHGPGDGARPSLATVAGILGISEDELKTQLQSGKTLAAIAGDKTDEVVDALVKEAEARIDQAVTDGKLTAEQATERKADLTQRITDMVNRTGPAPGHRHHDGPPPADGEQPAPEAAPASVTA